MPNNNKGFTLVEVLVALGIASVVLATAYSTFMGQNSSYKRQELITAMQQNLRAAVTFMSREIRMAGADPRSMGVAGIASADDNSINFTSDVSGGEDDGIDNDHDGQWDADDPDEVNYSDGDVDDPDENITYILYDAYSDGDMDIGRQIPNTSGSGTTTQPVAENIDTLNFVYLDGNGFVLSTPVADPTVISAIQLTIVARTERPIPNYTNNTVYQNLQGDTILDKSADPDGYRRLIASTTLKLRNINP